MRSYTLEEIQKREERKAKMRELHKSGMTLKEIAKEFGISHQRVATIIGGEDKRLFRVFTEERCVFIGLREWLNDNKVSVNELTRRIYGNSHAGNSGKLACELRGGGNMGKQKIDSILKITGLTYEKAFGCVCDTERQGYDIALKHDLDLIDRQKEEIDGLIAGQETLQKYIESKNKEIERLNARIKRVYKELQRIALMTVETDEKMVGETNG